MKKLGGFALENVARNKTTGTYEYIKVSDGLCVCLFLIINVHPNLKRLRTIENDHRRQRKQFQLSGIRQNKSIANHANAHLKRSIH